jgi:hypothetical protein
LIANNTAASAVLFASVASIDAVAAAYAAVVTSADYSTF